MESMKKTMIATLETEDNDCDNEKDNGDLSEDAITKQHLWT